MTTTCEHTEHAVRGSGRVGRYFRGLNDAYGAWEPCDDKNGEREFAIQSWERLLGSDIPRRNSEAESVLTDLLDRLHPRWVLQTRTLKMWVIAGGFDMKIGQHRRWVYVQFSDQGIISSWRTGHGGAWCEGVTGLAAHLLEEVPS